MSINIYRVVIISILMALVSCQKELSTEIGTTPIAGGPTTGGRTTSSDCKSCSYLPFCAGIKYTYSDTSATGAVTVRNADILSATDTVVGTKNYTKVNSNNQISYVRCINGETHQTVFGISVAGPNGPITIPKIETIGLKANEPVNAAWVDTNMNGASQTFYYKYRIVEKGINRTVAGKNFTDVIHVHMVTTIIAPIIGSFDTNTVDYYYAKSIGLIDYYVVDATSGIPTQILHSVLVSYFIP